MKKKIILTISLLLLMITAIFASTQVQDTTLINTLTGFGLSKTVAWLIVSALAVVVGKVWPQKWTDPLQIVLKVAQAIVVFLLWLNEKINKQSKKQKLEYKSETLKTKYSGILKVLILGLLFSGIGLTGFSQINTNHFFGTITTKAIKEKPVTSMLKGASTSTAIFLRPVINETAFEIPLKKRVDPQYFESTGIGLSAAFYKTENELPVERFALNFLLFTPNKDPLSSISTALTGSVPIPNIDLPFLLNAGIRYDWKAKVAWLQTGVTLEF